MSIYLVSTVLLHLAQPRPYVARGGEGGEAGQQGGGGSGGGGGGGQAVDHSVDRLQVEGELWSCRGTDVIRYYIIQCRFVMDPIIYHSWVILARNRLLVIF